MTRTHSLIPRMQSIAIVLLMFLVGGRCQFRQESLLPHFNCKKIAFYKTHKTGSTTLGGILFRIAVASNMSLYTTENSHFVRLGFKENQHMMGRADMVLHHIHHLDSPGFHAATRSFYGRALGTAEYGFLTILRHPVDRYISNFYYYVEPDARKAHQHVTLRLYASKGEGANRMAREFAVKDAAAAVQFVSGEMHADGLFLPLELLDYGLALLAAHCGWRLSRLIYLPANTNTLGTARYGNVTLSGRPSIAQLEEEDPALLNRIATINSVDAILYGAAYGQLLATLQLYGPAAAVTSAVMTAAVRLTAARKQLELDCRALHGGDRGAGGLTQQQAPLPPPGTRQSLSGDALAGLCAWLSIADHQYEKMPNHETGRVHPDAKFSPSATAPSLTWPVGHLQSLTDEYLRPYDNPSLPYYHSLLAVHVREPTAAEAELVYGMRYDGGGHGVARRLAVLSAAVRLWTIHHAREGFHHLVFLFDALNETQQQDAVQQAASAALGQEGSGGTGDGGGRSTLSYTTLSVIRCGDVSNPSEGSPPCSRAAPFLDAISRARWYATLSGLTYFMYGTRGSVRSVLLSFESTLQTAGSVCAPLVPWRTPPPGAPLIWPAHGTAGGQDRGGGGGGGGGGDDVSGEGDDVNIGRSLSAAAESLGRNEWVDTAAAAAAVWDNDITDKRARSGGSKGVALGALHGSLTGNSSDANGNWNTVLTAEGAEGRGSVVEGGSPGDEETTLSPPRRRLQHQPRRQLEQGLKEDDNDDNDNDNDDDNDNDPSKHQQHKLASSGGGDGGGGDSGSGDAASTAYTEACLRTPCSYSSSNSPRPCLMIRAMPMLGLTRPYTSSGATLPEGKSSYKVRYRGPEQQRLEVSYLTPPSEEDLRWGMENPESVGFRCSRLPGPKLRITRCS